MGFFTPTGPEAGKVSASSSLRSHKCQSLEQRNEQGNSRGRETSWDQLQSWQDDTSACIDTLRPNVRSPTALRVILGTVRIPGPELFLQKTLYAIKSATRDSDLLIPDNSRKQCDARLQQGHYWRQALLGTVSHQMFSPAAVESTRGRTGLRTGSATNQAHPPRMTTTRDKP